MDTKTGSVLFVDIVGYSARWTRAQEGLVRDLWKAANEYLRRQETSGNSGDPIILPTGDGMGIIFAGDPFRALYCAAFLAEKTRRASASHDLQIRMGIHSGPYIVLDDITGRRNAAGKTINCAQRVMDCGGAGHILCSGKYAEELIEHDKPLYEPRLTQLPSRKDKHGQQVLAWNYHDRERQVGNPNPPDWVTPVLIEIPENGSEVGPDGWDRDVDGNISVRVRGRVTSAVKTNEIVLARVIGADGNRQLHWCAKATVRDGHFEHAFWCGSVGDLRMNPRVLAVAMALDPPATVVFEQLHAVAQRLNTVLSKHQPEKDVSRAFWKQVQAGVQLWTPSADKVFGRGVIKGESRFTLVGL